MIMPIPNHEKGKITHNRLKHETEITCTAAEIQQQRQNTLTNKSQETKPEREKTRTTRRGGNQERESKQKPQQKCQKNQRR